MGLNLKYYVYGLLDPIDGIIRYVGKSYDPKQRLRQHVKMSFEKETCNPKFHGWIKGLIESGHQPILHIFLECDCWTLAFQEKRYINAYKVTIFNIDRKKKRV